MARKNNKYYRDRLEFVLICCMSSSLLITSYALPISVLANPLHSRHFIIAKPPDERQPEAVEKGIEQIPVTQPPVSQKRKESIESPLAPASTPTATGTTPATKPAATVTPSTPTATGTTPATKPAATVTPSTPTATGTTPATKPAATVTPSTPTATGTTPANKPAATVTPSTPTATGTTPANKPAATVTPSTPTATGTTPATQTSVRLSTPPPQRTRQPVTGGSPISTSITPTFREINFVDLAFGVLAPGDYQSQGRYFHFYQFEGRENQLIQIRLTGSADQRRSNNLSLNPFLLLLDSNNQVLLKRGTGEAVDSRGVKDAFIFVRLPAKGIYTIAVTSQNPKEKGRYSLALRNDRASYTLDQSGELTLEKSTLKQNGSPYNVSKFQGKKDQLVSIRVDSIFEQFSPYVVLLNSKGQIVASDSDKDGKYSVLIDRARLPADDTYYIIVISANAQERGAYRLTLF
ncbi:peptidase [Brasilonema sp. UFV-L1]|uniref:peptidase n=1 Tax=Brasilonema sp. UFV-L1 TaxID=2234130 RepID=UPI00145E12EF|nr:peptidase [Brasilonema sp. UFV-L1]NMG07288.1 peptidase [Brasilonema sp. UFV-L1]